MKRASKLDIRQNVTEVSYKKKQGRKCLQFKMPYLLMFSITRVRIIRIYNFGFDEKWSNVFPR
jgi:hypothetical protein